MIPSNHLRPGNLIQDMGDGIGAVTGLYPDGSIETTANNLPLPPENYEGVPITAEWLRRCGFEVKDDNPKGKPHYEGDVLVNIAGYEFSNSATSFSDGGFYCYDINNGNTIYKYVHQVQNFVNIITGSELVIQAGSGAG